MFILLLYSVFCKLVKFDILYEKIENPNSLKLAEFLIMKVLDEYNAKFSEVDIQFRLESFYTYNLYSTIPEYKEFSRLTGSRDLNKKLLSLNKINTNVIVLFSSQRNEDTSKVNIASFCNGRYFFNLKESEVNDGIIRVSIDAIRRWIGFVLKTKIPEIYSLENISFINSIDEEVIDDVFNCPSYNKNKEKKNHNSPMMTSKSNQISIIEEDQPVITSRGISNNKNKRLNKNSSNNNNKRLNKNSSSNNESSNKDRNMGYVTSEDTTNNRSKDIKNQLKNRSNSESSVVISHSEDTLLRKFRLPNTTLDDQ